MLTDEVETMRRGLVFLNCPRNTDFKTPTFSDPCAPNDLYGWIFRPINFYQRGVWLLGNKILILDNDFWLFWGDYLILNLMHN